MKIVLWSCPFCGSKPEMIKWHGGKPTKRMISCENEECHVAPSVIGETPTEAADRWNHRVVVVSQHKLKEGK